MSGSAACESDCSFGPLGISSQQAVRDGRWGSEGPLHWASTHAITAGCRDDPGAQDERQCRPRDVVVPYWCSTPGIGVAAQESKNAAPCRGA